MNFPLIKSHSYKCPLISRKISCKQPPDIWLALELHHLLQTGLLCRKYLIPFQQKYLSLKPLLQCILIHFIAFYPRGQAVLAYLLCSSAVPYVLQDILYSVVKVHGAYAPISKMKGITLIGCYTTLRNIH